MISKITTSKPPSINIDALLPIYHEYPYARTQSQQPTCFHELSSLLSSVCESSSPPAFIEATIGAIAGAGVVDLFVLAACNL